MRVYTHRVWAHWQLTSQHNSLIFLVLLSGIEPQVSWVWRSTNWATLSSSVLILCCRALCFKSTSRVPSLNSVSVVTMLWCQAWYMCWRRDVLKDTHTHACTLTRMPAHAHTRKHSHSQKWWYWPQSDGYDRGDLSKWHILGNPLTMWLAPLKILFLTHLSLHTTNTRKVCSKGVWITLPQAEFHLNWSLC